MASMISRNRANTTRAARIFVERNVLVHFQERAPLWSAVTCHRLCQRRLDGASCSEFGSLVALTASTDQSGDRSPPSKAAKSEPVLSEGDQTFCAVYFKLCHTFNYFLQ